MTVINPAKTKFEHAEPILRVSEMTASLNYYVDTLGFRAAEWGTAGFTSVNRERSRNLSLCRWAGTAGDLGLDWSRGRWRPLRRIQNERRQDPQSAGKLCLGLRNASRRSGRSRFALRFRTQN
jgi:hypothetical protein